MMRDMLDAIRVLFVEDDAATLNGYAAYLSGQGCDVIPVRTGHDALTMAQTTKFDVVVLDLGLPDVDGWEVARHLKASAATAQVPVIALTGADLPHERVSAMRAGCDRYLVKPCAPTDLLNMIHRTARPAPTA